MFLSFMNTFSEAAVYRCFSKLCNTQDEKKTPTHVFSCKKHLRDINILRDFLLKMWGQ